MRPGPKIVLQPLSWAPPEDRMLRGGSWLPPSRRLRAASRDWDLPRYGYGHFGFRVVLEVK